MNKRIVLSIFTTQLLLTGLLFGQGAADKAVRPIPSDAQVAWHATEFYFFFHFGPNTFTDLEWGNGTEPEDVFKPSELDCDQWCRIAKAAGAKGVIITAKHHDGFCLWPSKYSKHTVRESKWKDGKGDVLKELSSACKRHGLKFGVYLSPWDRNHPQYGTPEYNDVYAQTLVELLVNYGDLFEIWWDGANGEGKNGKKQEYDFHRFELLVKRYQPKAVIFSDIGPGCRWAGNEQGTVNETNWCMLDTAGFGRGATGPAPEVLQTGQENGKLWIPAECDVSIRPGWFYHQKEDSKVKSPDELFDIYLKSVGRGGNLILNVPPDRRGKIADQDSISLVAFGQKLKSAFDQNLAYQKDVTVTGMHQQMSARQLTDGLGDSQLTLLPKAGQNTLGAFEVDLKGDSTINCIKLIESVRKTGQRVKAFTVEVWDKDHWKEVTKSTTIGPRKILRFPTTKTNKVRVVIQESVGFASIGEIQLYHIE